MSSTRKRIVIASTAALLLVGLAGCGGGTSTTTAASDFPRRDITLIVPFSAGGSTDIIGRQVAQMLGTISGVSVVVENVAGGGGSIGTVQGLTSAPDGYTLVYSSNSILGFQPLANPDLPFGDPDSYTPLAKLSYQATNLVVRQDSPFQTLDDFIAHAKQHPGELRLSNSGAHTTNDVMERAWAQAAGIEITRVPMTQGASESMENLLSGTTDGAMEYAASAVHLTEGGLARCLAVFDTVASKLFPDCPLVPEYADPKISIPPAAYLIAPPGLPADVEQKLVDMIKEMVAMPEWAQFMDDRGMVPDAQFADTWVHEVVEAQEVFKNLPPE